MRKLLSLSLFVLALAVTSWAQTKKVAVMETKNIEGVSAFQSSMVRGGMETAVANAEGYEGYDRAAFDVIMQEQNFQRSGAVNETQITQLGQMAGVQYVLVTEASAEDGFFYIIAKLLDVETGRFVKSVDKLCQATPTEIKSTCAEIGVQLFSSNLMDHAQNNGAASITKPTEKQETIVPTKPSKKENTRIPEVPSIVTPPVQHNNLIVKEKKLYYLNGQAMSQNEFSEFIKNNCPQAYASYQKGKNTKLVGWLLLGVGVGITSIFPATSSSYSSGGTTIISSSFAGQIVGGALAIISIPVLISGNSKKNNAYKVYNQSCTQPTTTLNIGPTNSGLGISLNF